MTFLVTKTIEFDAAHRVPDHKSKCFNLHGHRYKVEATAVWNMDDDDLNRGSGESDDGMVVDFGDLKKAMMESIHDQYDHASIFYQGDPLGLDLHRFWGSSASSPPRMKVWLVDFIPTAENLAQSFWWEISNHPLHKDQTLWTLMEVTVWETPTSKATYRP